VGADIGREGVVRDELDSLTEHCLEKITKCHETIQDPNARMEFDEYVYVAVRPRLVPHDRSKQREPPHPELEDLLGILLKPAGGFLSGKDDGCHGTSLTITPSNSKRSCTVAGIGLDEKALHSVQGETELEPGDLTPRR